MVGAQNYEPRFAKGAGDDRRDELRADARAIETRCPLARFLVPEFDGVPRDRRARALSDSEFVHDGFFSKIKLEPLHARFGSLPERPSVGIDGERSLVAICGG